MATIARDGAVRFQDDAGIRRRNIGIYTGPAVYALGGDSCTLAELGLTRCEFITFEDALDLDGGLNIKHSLVYNRTTSMIMWFDCSTGAETAAGSDLSAISSRFEAVGLS